MSHATQISDSSIIDLFFARDENAIKETDGKYGRYLYKIAHNILHNALDAEECMNDIYFAVWNRIPPTKPASLIAFLSQITRRIAISHYRKNTASKNIPSAMLSSLSELEETVFCEHTEQEFDSVRTAKVISAYLHTVSQRRMLIFVYRYYYADTIADIAKMLRLSEPTVYRELTKIRTELRAYLNAHGIDC